MNNGVDKQIMRLCCLEVKIMNNGVDKQIMRLCCLEVKIMFIIIYMIFIQCIDDIQG